MNSNPVKDAAIITASMVCYAAMAAGVVGAVYFLRWWAVLIVPIIMFCGYYCVLKIYNYGL